MKLYYIRRKRYFSDFKLEAVNTVKRFFFFKFRLSMRYRSCIFHSCIFHPCDLLPHFPLLHFPLPHFQRPRQKPGGRLPLLSARPAITSHDSEHHRPLTGTKLYCLLTEARICNQLSQGCTRQRGGQDSNPRSVDRKSGSLTTRPPSLDVHSHLYDSHFSPFP